MPNPAYTLTPGNVEEEQELPEKLTLTDIFELFAKEQITEESAAELLEEIRKSRNGIIERFASYSTRRL